MKLYRYFFLVIIVLSTNFLAYTGSAQSYNHDVTDNKPPDDFNTSGNITMRAEGDPDPNCDPLDPGCPIDGGLSALLLLGAGYGIRGIRRAKKGKTPAV